MLAPSKHLDLDTSVLRVASIILKELKKRGVVQFEKLRHLIVKRVGADGELAFMPSLSFLFLLGAVEYHVKTDALEYTGG